MKKIFIARVHFHKEIIEARLLKETRRRYYVERIPGTVGGAWRFLPAYITKGDPWWLVAESEQEARAFIIQKLREEVDWARARLDGRLAELSLWE